MSSVQINPAPSPTPGASASSGAASHSASGGQGPQGHDAIKNFELVLEQLFGVATTPVPAGTANVTTKSGDNKPGDSKTADGATDDKVTGDDKVAGADSAAANPSADALAAAAAATAATPAAVQAPATVPDGGAEAALANVASAADKATATAQPALAGSGVAVDPDAAKAQTQDQAKVAVSAQPIPDLAVTAADSAAIDAGATAKANPPATPKTDPAQPTQAPAPQAAPAADPQAAPPAEATPPVVAAPPAPAAERPAEPVAPVAAKERVQAIKTSTRVDSVKTATNPGSIAALTAKAADALQPVVGGGAPKDSFDDEPAEQALIETKVETAPAATQAPGDPATAATTAPAHLIHAAAVAVRGQPQTVANLAAQIVKKLDGRSSQFDVQLDPVGLGKVDVRIAIGSDGRMSAAMSFDTPQAAAELKARAAELHQAMAQAGFDLTGGMSFDVASDRGQGQGNQAQNQQPEAGAAFRGRAFQAALDNSADTPPPQYALRRTALAGVDIRI